ncbi:hypothetical protein GLYMA_04G135800v4 [Glycine max]|uniref:Uncharacterized protein n=2 Tax=Glycine subgen. Soja TaxID=1462606 RepID=K7KJZ2_SOYBN|nr:uncharacterized protein LOC102666582 [Glycine max]XP_028228772.1 uncharacterized protein LOC114409488 [Glycine soja]KAG5049202.1 hypothetical protein JHK85_010305 [Glycine max]KAH1111223.1 hypothetical protein GYH30_009844 [Glycine max]KAH1253958.1 hypothetical protein GmHk_04G010501 [Glycine max]KRH62835.1 hypothetical protein GLYMA_04G135800v4 [Glycine max]RZC16434.1 hypothetical protein D0Y65_009625 [Glycine soja]|eukprot:XP_006578429.1 uncharacterized protein LOC102666582 [Glycine max]
MLLHHLLITAIPNLQPLRCVKTLVTNTLVESLTTAVERVAGEPNLGWRGSFSDPALEPLPRGASSLASERPRLLSHHCMLPSSRSGKHKPNGSFEVKGEAKEETNLCLAAAELHLSPLPTNHCRLLVFYTVVVL